MTNSETKSSSTSRSKRMVGSFELQEQLAQGGMGVVHLATQPALGRRVVLKTLRRELADDPTLVDRFEREAGAAAAIHHQNVVSVYDCFAWRGSRYIAQEFVDGMDLSRVLEATSQVEPRVAALIILEIARGLEEIHSRGIIHRDLKPSNVLLGRSGETKVADFGIALDPLGPALTRTGQALGTPPYMSPEQYRGDRVDERSDLFAVGVILYEMLVGDPPFAPTDPQTGEGLLRRIEAGRYASPRRGASETPRYLVRLISACLRPKPRKRLQSATALRRSLERHLHRPSPTDCRAEIEAWLMTKELFAAEELPVNASTLPIEPAPARGPGPLWRLATIAASLTLALIAPPQHIGFSPEEPSEPARHDNPGSAHPLLSPKPVNARQALASQATPSSSPLADIVGERFAHPASVTAETRSAGAGFAMGELDAARVSPDRPLP
ncbi:serine/threonine protein kinase [Myxococcota bacterium]|nr:serine/threonine protein kinase [Myxococcota bacterium]